MNLPASPAPSSQPVALVRRPRAQASFRVAEQVVDFSRLEHVLVLLDATPNVGVPPTSNKRGAER